MHRLAQKMKQKRIDALSYFEDYDFVREGKFTSNEQGLSLPINSGLCLITLRCM